MHHTLQGRISILQIFDMSQPIENLNTFEKGMLLTEFHAFFRAQIDRFDESLKHVPMESNATPTAKYGMNGGKSYWKINLQREFFA